MYINVRNIAKVPNKYIRNLKFKFYRLQEKFKHLESVSVYLSHEGTKHKNFILKMVLQMNGQNLVLVNYSDNIGALCSKSMKVADFQLAKVASKR